MKRKISIFIVFMITALYTFGAITISKESNVTAYIPGETITYTIRVENDDNINSVADLVVTDNMSGLGLENFNLVTATTNNLSGTTGNPIISGEVFSTNPFSLEASDGLNNRYVEYTFTGTVSVGATGDIVNTASAKEGSNIEIVSDPVTISEFDDSNIVITKTSDVSEYDNGDDITYTVEVRNKSSKKIEGLTITDDFFSLGGISNPVIVSVYKTGEGTNTGNTSISTASNGLNQFIAENVTLDGLDSHVSYVIKGTVDAGEEDPLKSTANVKGNFIDKSVESSLNRTEYIYTVSKSTSSTSYSPNGDVIYIFKLKNNSDNTVKGLEVSDLLSNIKADVVGGIKGDAFGNITVSAVTTGIGSFHGMTSDPLSGDLVATDVKIGPKGSVTYTITATVNSDVVGEIKNTATIKETTRNDNIVTSGEASVFSGLPIVGISKSALAPTNYLPGDEIIYTVTVNNTGTGIAENYYVKDLLSTLGVDLANDSDNLESSQDITGTPFSNGEITMTSIGSNSSSTNYTKKIAENSIDLNDTIIIFPGESVTYQIAATTGLSAIGKIENTATVDDGINIVTSGVVTTNPKELNVDDIEIVKTIDTVEYTPGDTVTYNIKVSNNSSDQFANNISIVDKINSILAEQLDGSIDKAFSSWTLNVISPTSSSNGTKPGTSITGSSTSNDINLLADLAPGKNIEYELVAVVSDTTIGPILDVVDDGLDTVVEIGTGIQMASSKIGVSKSVDSTEYSPNQIITYEITVENGGDGYAAGISITDSLGSIVSDTGDKAYSSWEITSRLEALGSLPALGTSGLDLEPETGDLNVTATIGPATKIVYTIKAIIDGKATGKIKNIATIDGTLVADRGIFPVDSKVSASKSVVGSYVYTGGDFIVPYTITVQNASDGGYASGIEVTDDLNDLEVPLLEGTTLGFDSYTIVSATENGSGTESTGATIDGGILQDTVNITAGGSVVYVVEARISESNIDQNNIPYGSFTNTATIVHGGDTYSPSATTGPLFPSLSITKTADKTDLSGDEAEFTVRIENSGPGYAEDAIVTDPVIGLSNLNITESSSGLGSNSNISGDLATGLTVDIAPGGWVQYKIIGNVDPTVEIISNTAKVEDIQNNLIYEASAKIDRVASGDIEITKTVDKKVHEPGGELIYTIEVKNKSADIISFLTAGYTIEDIIGDPSYNLANDDTPFVDVKGNPFRSWSITKSGDVVSSTNGVLATTNILDQPTIAGGESVKYTIEAIVKDTLLPGQKITNKAEIKNQNDDVVAIASVQTNGEGDSGGRTITLDKDRYIPGESLTYTITFSGGSNGYYNNFEINELLSNMTVETLNGLPGHPFDDGIGNINYTINRTSSISNSKDGNSSDINVFPTSGSNKDLIGTEELDLAPNDKVIYTVTGIVRPDAAGDIEYSGQISQPYRHNLNTTKKLKESSYMPGEEMTFVIEISNTSTGNANNISIYDDISSLKVALSDGTVGFIFEPMEWKTTIRSEAIGTDYTAFASSGAVGDNSNINTTFDLPISTKIIYEITGIANSKAIGTVENIVLVDGDTVTGEAASGKPDLTGKKEILAYYDIDGTTKLTGGYKPGGWIEYLITLENKNGTGIRDNLPLEDKISEIISDYVDGSNGPAFSTWEISLSESTNDESTVPGLGIWENDPGRILIDKDLIKGNPTNPDTSPDLSKDEIPVLIDLAPGGKVVIKIKAKIDERVVGNIKNTVSAGSITKSSGTSTMLEPNAKISKQAYTADASGNITTTVKNSFDPGDIFYYKVRIGNDGDGISSGTVVDEISKIESEVSQDGTNGNEPKENPFSSWEITAIKGNDDITVGSSSAIYNDGNDNITNFGTFGSSANNSDIDSSEVYIAPGGYIEYTVKAKINDNVLSRIRNVAVYTDQIKKSQNGHNIDPVNASLELSKSITYIGTDPENLTGNKTLYSPGDYVIYKVEVKNTEDSFGNDIIIEDILSEIKTEIAGGGEEPVFESWEITDKNIDTRTYIPNYTSSNQDLNIEIDIAPKDIITFTIKAKIKDNIIGTIPVNTVVAKKDKNTELKNAKSDEIKPNPPILSYNKEISNDGINYVTTNVDYIPSNSLYYKITLENSGLGYGVKVKVKDILKDILDSKGNPAFSSGTIEYKITGSNTPTDNTTDGNTYIYNLADNLNGFDVEVDIEPDAKVEFFIDAKVKNTALGDIKNIANIDDLDTNEVIANLAKSTIISTKTGDASYGPRAELNYTLTVENTGDSTAQDIILNEIISNIKVETIDKTEKAAFKSEWVISTVLSDLDGNSDISQIPTSGDITNIPITLGTKDKVTITITATVIDDAIGDIDNIFTTKYNDIETPKSWKASPSDGVISVTKIPVENRTSTIEDPNYIPGKEKTFLIEVKNTGSGFALGVDILDKLMEIETLGGGNFLGDTVHKVDAFREDSNDTPLEVRYESKENYSDTDIIGTLDKTLGFDGEVNIAPGDTFQIWITTLLNEEAMKEITSDVDVTFGSNDPLNAEATITSIENNIEVEKEISTDGNNYSTNNITYSPGDTIYYKITAYNNKDAGWADDIEIVDAIKEIQADISGGGQGPAFDPSTIEITYASTRTPSYNKIDSSDNNLNGIFDLAPEETITFDIKAIINNNVVGGIENTAKFIENALEKDTNTVVAIPKVIDLEGLTITKEQSIDGINYSDGSLEYSSGGKGYYRIIVRNNNTSFIRNLKIQDIVDGIMVDSSGTPNSIEAFNLISVTPTINAPSKVIETPDYTKGVDVTLDLAPNDEAEFIIESTIIDTAIGEIKNIASYEYNGAEPVKKEVILKPKNANIEIEKISMTEKYTPGGEIIYNVTLKNTGEGIANEVNFTDNLSTILSKLSDGNTGNAIKADTVEAKVIEVVKGLPLGITTATPSLVVMSNIVTSTFDLAPQGSIKIEIKGITVDNLIGEVENTALYEFTNNDKNTSTGSDKVTISSEDYSVNVIKKISLDGVTYGTEPVSYKPGDTIYYKITTTNIGEGWADDVTIKDEITKMTSEVSGTGGDEVVFDPSSIEIRYETTGTNNDVVIDTNLNDVDAKFDLEPGTNVEIYVSAKVRDNVLGIINNTANISSLSGDVAPGTTNTVVANPSNAELIFTKVLMRATTIDYNVGEELHYQVVVENTTNSFANNVSIIDNIKSIEVVSSEGGLVPAFETFRVDTPIFGNINNTKLASEDYTNGVDVLIDLAPKDTVTFDIYGTVIDTAIGEIKNIASYEYNGADPVKKEVILKPKNANIEIEKISMTEKYTPGGEIIYNVTLKNTGEGIANDINFTDNLSAILSEFSDGNTGNAIKDDTVEAKVIEIVEGLPLGITTATPSLVVMSNIVTSTFDLAPQGSIKIEIKGITVDNLIGEVENTALYEFTNNDKNTSTGSDKVTISSEDYSVNVIKKISLDGVTYGIKPVSYKSGDTIYYKITTTNIGEGWADDVTIKDEITKMMSEVSGTEGEEVVFDPSSIEIRYETTGTNNDVVIDTNLNDVDAKFDLEPGTNVEIYVSAKVRDNVLGIINNTANISSLSGNVTPRTTNTVVANPADAELTITKMLVRETTIDYNVGEELHYQVVVENTTNSFANNVSIIDNIKSIEVVSSEGNLISAFETFRVDAPIFSNINTKLVSEDYANGVDVLIDLASKDKVIFDIYGTVIDTAIGEIKNTASYEYNGADPVKKEVILKPKNANVEIEKISMTEKYTPGGEIIYNVTLKNTGEGIANDISFTDNLSSILSELSDGNTGNAIKADTVEAKVIEIVEGLPLGITTATPSLVVMSNIVTSTFDLAPQGSIKIEIKGITVDNLIGEVENTALYEFTNNDKNTSTGSDMVEVGQMNAKISIIKKAIVDPDLQGYIPGEEMEFRIKVSNDGPGIANNIKILDEIDKVMVETTLGSQKAFSSWKIEIVDEGDISLPSFIPNVFPIEDSNLDIVVDIAPGDTLEFKVIAVAIDDAFGEISNTAEASYENNKNNDGSDAPSVSDSDTFIPSRSEVEISIKVDKSTYAPGEEITYTIILKNIGPGPAHKVKFENILPQATTTTGNGEAFDSTTSKVVSIELFNNATENISLNNTNTGNTFVSELELPRDGYVVYTITSNVSPDIIGDILNIAKFDYTDNDGTPKKGEATAQSKPENALVTITKEADTEEFIAGNPITYTIKINNAGPGIANDVTLKDLLMDIEVKSVDGSDINAFESVTITDNVSTLYSVSSVESYDPNENLDVKLDIAPGETAEFVIVGVTNKLVGEDIINTAKYSFTNNDGSSDEGSADATSEVILNEGQLVLTKQAFQDTIEKGEVVEYEILVRNTTDVYFTNVSVEDKIPSGFKYVEDSTVMTLSGADGKFKTTDDENVSDEPIKGNTLSYTAVNIGPNESLRIRYILKASIGTTFGKYVNTAYAVSEGKEVSNRDSATVEVIPDVLFDTATIIGKAYEDLNGDGYQADATAKKIELKGGVSVASYIPNSTTLEIGGKIENIPDASPPIQHGITIGQLRGVSRNRKIKEPNKAILRYETIDSKWEPLNITSKAGTQIYIDSDGNVTTNHKGDVKKGLASERLKITRNVYRQKEKSTYLQEIILENIGLYEDGIPGIRLITVDGIVVETDEFGRYHVPDEWVLRKNGKNFIVKVDEDSVPQGMQVISENPRVRRITPNGLNKFNFSIQRIEDDFDIGDTKGIVEIGGGENE